MKKIILIIESEHSLILEQIAKKLEPVFKQFNSIPQVKMKLVKQ